MTDNATSPAPAPASSERFCRACGYPLTTAPDYCTCPECGKTGPKEQITCPPGRPLPTWPRFALGLCGIPLGTLAWGALMMFMIARRPSMPLALIAVVILFAAAVLALLVPLVVAVRWSAQSTMPFERRRRMISIIAIFALGATINLVVALPVIRHCLAYWSPTN